MRIFIIGSALLLSLECFALEAVVTVLETPMLREKSKTSQAVQYLRRGDVIKIHPSAGRSLRFENLAPPPEKLAALKQRLENENVDPMFMAPSPIVNADQDEFVPVLDRQGRTAYVLAAHLYVYYEELRELDQRVVTPDPTDYRLEEPLPSNYPLSSPIRFRGQGILGVTQPSYRSYPYSASIRARGYTNPIDFNYTFLKRTADDIQERFFFGGTLGFRYGESDFLFADGRTSTEKNFKLNIGPYISYDAYKGVLHRINLFGSVNINVLNQLLITQSDKAGSIDERTYRGWSLAPRIGTQYHRKKILEELETDFVFGTYLELETPFVYKAIDAGSENLWWQSTGTDSFRSSLSVNLAIYLGLQSSY